jgi:hypothetical protein
LVWREPVETFGDGAGEHGHRIAIEASLPLTCGGPKSLGGADDHQDGGPVGSCFHDAMIESFGSRMQVELLDRRSWRTRVELANAIFEYLEIFHNRQRRHSALGMFTPVEFETRHETATAA